MRRMTPGRWNDGDLSLNPIALRRVRCSRGRALPNGVDAARNGLADGAGALSRPGCRTWPDHDLPAALGAHDLVAHWFVTTGSDTARYEAVVAIPDTLIAKLELAFDAAPAAADAARVTADTVWTALSAAGNTLLGTGDRAGIGTWLDARLAELADAATSGPARELDLPPPRVRAVDTCIIAGDADRWFPLACPVAELDWIDDWHFDLLYSNSGRNEDDNIFNEPLSGIANLRVPRAHTAWDTTVWDVPGRRFHAVLLTESLTMGLWTFELHDLGGGRARWELALAYDALCPAGERLLDEPDVQRRMARTLAFIRDSALHYIERGTIMRLPVREKARRAIAVVATQLGRQLRRLHRAA